MPNNHNKIGGDGVREQEELEGTSKAKELMTKVYDTYIEMELPGHILYIYQIGSSQQQERSNWCSCCRSMCGSMWVCSTSCCCPCFCRANATANVNASAAPAYDSRWASNEEFKRILITNRMLLDHFPNTVENALSYFNSTERRFSA